MKTTLDIPDEILRRAKVMASAHGVSLSQFVSQAVEEKLNSPTRFKARARLVGGLRHLRKETARINRIIEAEFETIEPEERA